MILATASAVSFACSSTLAKIAYVGGGSSGTVACLRFCLPVIVLAGWLRASQLPLVLPVKGVAVASLMGAITAAFSWALLSAINVVPVAQAILVFYLFPLVLAAILIALQSEKISILLLAQTALAMAGLAFALEPQSRNLNLEGLILAFGAAVGFAVVIALSSYASRENDSRLLTLYMSGVAAAALFVATATQGQFHLPSTSIGWVGLTGSAAFYSFGLIAFFVAIPKIGPMRVSLLLYAEPVATSVLGVLLLNENLTWFQIIGIVLTISALLSVTAAPLPIPD